MSILQLVLATVCWGVLFSVGKLISPHLPPFALTLARYGLAAVFLMPFAWRQFGRIERADVPRLLAVGLLSSLCFNGLLFFGLKFAPAGDSVLAPAVVPLLTTFLSVLFFRERPTGAKLAALAVSVVGVGLVFSAVLRGGGGSGRIIGDLFIVAAALSWSGYLLLSAPFAGRYSPLLLTGVTCLTGALGSLPLALWEGGLGRFAALPGQAWPELLYISGVGTVLAFTLWSRGSEALGPARAAAYMNLVPIFGLVSSVLFLHEQLGAGQLIGMALVLAGVWGTTLASRASLRVMRIEESAIARV